MLQLRETPLCTGADRAVIQNNLAGAAIQRADMCSVYQAGFVTEKKALVEFGERFIQGAAALVDRSRRMDGDAVRTGRFDIKNFMDWYESILIGHPEMQPTVRRSRNFTFLENALQTVKNLQGVVRIVFD